MPARASHLLVLQDDALLCRGFPKLARAAVAARPEALLALFTPGFPFLLRRLEQEQRKGETFTALPPAAFVPLVATVYPRGHVEGLLAFTDGTRWPRARKLGTADDAIVAAYTRSLRLAVVATIPCLVDHDDSVASISKPSHRPGTYRRAALLAD